MSARGMFLNTVFFSPKRYATPPNLFMRLVSGVFAASTLLWGLLACSGGGGGTDGESSPSGAVLCTGSSPTWNCGPSYAGLDNLINRNLPPGFQRGDTVNVSAGSATWTGNTLSLTTGVKLLGPGRANLTIISRTGTVTAPIIAIQPDATAITNEETIRVDGFTFDGGGSSLVAILVTGAGANSAKPFKNLMIGYNAFRNSQPSSGFNGAVYTTGQTRGVIYNNIFDRQMVVFRCLGNNEKTEWTNGAFPFAFGNSDNLFFENNTILWSSSFTATGNGFPGGVQCEQGGRAVVRYNTWDFKNVNNADELWDTHGSQNFPGGQTSTFVVEYYGNTITTFSGFRIINHRGSWGIYHNNFVFGSSNPGINMSQYDGGCNALVDATWPPPNAEINNTYVFNNSVNGTNTSADAPVTALVNSICPPTENVTFWNPNVAGCTTTACATGIGRGTTEPTGTCTIGTGYWVNSEPIATVDPNIIQNGIFYKCTDTDTWSAYYAPYSYPHPLRM
jgi:hypothetical protein